MKDIEWSRREFLHATAIAGGVLTSAVRATSSQQAAGDAPTGTKVDGPGPVKLPDLSPARWIWYPSGRTLPNTFIRFRHEVVLPARPKRAVGWIAADSRYRLDLNGERIQWGPAPSDPRWAEADPLDLTAALQEGTNVLGATVLFYGHGDGTWPIGKCGFLFRLEIEHEDNSTQTLVSDSSWRCLLARCWSPGHYKRWYLRSLQEEFDARLDTPGWNRSGFAVTPDWLPAMLLDGSPNRPALATTYPDTLLDAGIAPPEAELRPRSIPMMRESLVPCAKLSESFSLAWKRPPQDYFDMRVPDAFEVDRKPCARETGPGVWTMDLDGQRGASVTFEFTEQVVGWPYFTIEAAEGTTVELLVQEAHEVGGPPLLNTHFDSWSRFVCRQGENVFETFDFESLRWLQLHVHGPAGRVVIRNVGVRRRVFPWPHVAEMKCSDPAIQKLYDASFNTLDNCAQETLVDGMARERQQYSGDGAHQMHAVILGYGETRLPSRFIRTFSQGITKDGFFLDCWPAFDRLQRLVERQLDTTRWGPILDHGVQFVFDCWNYYLYTGDLEAVREAYPRLVRFVRYLNGLVRPDGLLPVEDLGIPSVWIDHVAYQKQRHKQCAFNLYVAAMLKHAMIPLAETQNDAWAGGRADSLANGIRAAAHKAFWDSDRGLYVVNKPWLAEEKTPRLCDRSLATSVLFDQCPDGRNEPALKALADCPPEMGFSYPCNAGWRLWALAKGGRADVVVRDFRERWAPMASVQLNNTLQEDWQALPDSGAQWSHCAVVPLYVTYMSLAGIRPASPGCRDIDIRPQLADLTDLELTAFFPPGPIRFEAHGKLGDRELTIDLPKGIVATLMVPAREQIKLNDVGGASSGFRWYRLPSGKKTTLRLQTV